MSGNEGSSIGVLASEWICIGRTVEQVLFCSVHGFSHWISSESDTNVGAIVLVDTTVIICLVFDHCLRKGLNVNLD